jgi:hypothetical protein
MSAQVRLMNFAHALLFFTIRGETKVEDLQRLVNDGFCTKAEVSLSSSHFIARLGYTPVSMVAVPS